MGLHPLILLEPTSIVVSSDLIATISIVNILLSVAKYKCSVKRFLKIMLSCINGKKRDNEAPIQFFLWNFKLTSENDVDWTFTEQTSMTF